MGYLGRLAITVYGDFASQKKTFKLLRYAGVDVYDRPAGEFFNFYILIFLSFFFVFSPFSLYVDLRLIYMISRK